MGNAVGMWMNHCYSGDPCGQLTAINPRSFRAMAPPVIAQSALRGYNMSAENQVEATSASPFLTLSLEAPTQVSKLPDGACLLSGNLHRCFLIIAVVAILTHSLSGNVTGDVLQTSLIAVPFVLMGSAAGFYLDRFINPAVFRKIVLVLLLILGINLALTCR